MQSSDNNEEMWGFLMGKRFQEFGDPSAEIRINLKNNWPGRKTPYYFRAIILLLSARHLSVPLLSIFFYLSLRKPGMWNSGLLSPCAVFHSCIHSNSINFGS